MIVRLDVYAFRGVTFWWWRHKLLVQKMNRPIPDSWLWLIGMRVVILVYERDSSWEGRSSRGEGLISKPQRNVRIHAQGVVQWGGRAHCGRDAHKDRKEQHAARGVGGNWFWEGGDHLWSNTMTRKDVEDFIKGYTNANFDIIKLEAHPGRLHGLLLLDANLLFLPASQCSSRSRGPSLPPPSPPTTTTTRATDFSKWKKYSSFGSIFVELS